MKRFIKYLQHTSGYHIVVMIIGLGALVFLVTTFVVAFQRTNIDISRRASEALRGSSLPE